MSRAVTYNDEEKRTIGSTGTFSEMGFIIFHRHHSLNFRWVSIFESK